MHLETMRKAVPHACSIRLLSSNTNQLIPAAGAIFIKFGVRPLYMPRSPSCCKVFLTTSNMPVYFSGAPPIPCACAQHRPIRQGRTYRMLSIMKSTVLLHTHLFSASNKGDYPPQYMSLNWTHSGIPCKDSYDWQTFAGVRWSQPALGQHFCA